MAIFDHTQGKPAVTQGGTFSANPLTMTAGLASLEAYDAAAVARLNGLGEALRQAIASGLAALGLPAQVTGFGSLFRLHFFRHAIADYRSAYASTAQRRALALVHRGLLDRGILLTPTGSGALSTPMTDTDIQDLSTNVLEAIRDVYSNQPWT
jgi:glutamate-1-semialdehyde 2,1-aminomutase